MSSYSDYTPLFSKLNLLSGRDADFRPTAVNQTGDNLTVQIPNGQLTQVTNCAPYDCVVLFRSDPNGSWSTSSTNIQAQQTINMDIAANIQYQLSSTEIAYRSAIYTAPDITLLPDQVAFRPDVSSIGPCDLQIIATTVYNGFNQPLNLYTRYHVQQPWYQAGVVVGAQSVHSVVVPLGFQLILASRRPNSDITVVEDDLVASNIYTLTPGYDGSTIYLLPDGTVRFGITYDPYAQSSTESWWARWWWVVLLIVLLVLLIIGFIIWASFRPKENQIQSYPSYN